MTLINFSIKGTSYQAEEGMTWEQWVNSAYNTGGFDIAKKFVTTSDGLFLTVSPENSSYISINEIIIADHQYGAYY